MELYDLIVLGGGPAGYNAAERAAEEGLKTLLFEGRALGGVCLNEGCIPTKTLLYSAKIYDYAKHGPEYGVSFDGAKIDHKAVVERKGRVVKMLVGGIGATLKKAGVTVVSENAKITGRDGEGYTVAAAGTEYKAKKLLVSPMASPYSSAYSGIRHITPQVPSENCTRR